MHGMPFFFNMADSTIKQNRLLPSQKKHRKVQAADITRKRTLQAIIWNSF